MTTNFFDICKISIITIDFLTCSKSAKWQLIFLTVQSSKQLFKTQSSKKQLSKKQLFMHRLKHKRVDLKSTAEKI